MKTHNIMLSQKDLTTIRASLEKARLGALLAPKGQTNPTEAFSKSQEYESVLQSLPIPIPDPIQDFLDNAIETRDEFLERLNEQWYVPERHNIELSFGGKVLKVELCAQAWELLEKFVSNLAEIKNEITVLPC